MDALTTTCTTVGSFPKMSHADLVAEMNSVMYRLQAFTLESEARWLQFMHDNGHDPERGWILVLPESMKQLGMQLKYIRFSRLIDKPIFVNPLLAGLPVLDLRSGGNRG